MQVSILELQLVVHDEGSWSVLVQLVAEEAGSLLQAAATVTTSSSPPVAKVLHPGLAQLTGWFPLDLILSTTEKFTQSLQQRLPATRFNIAS
jgi:hypothetical protein